MDIGYGCYGPPGPDPELIILGLLLLWMARDEFVELIVLAERAIDVLIHAMRPAGD